MLTKSPFVKRTKGDFLLPEKKLFLGIDLHIEVGLLTFHVEKFCQKSGKLLIFNEK